MVSWVGIGAETIFLRFQSLTRPWSKFDQGVEKALCCAQKLHGRHICCMGEYMVMISVTYMGFSAFVLLTAMVIRPKLPKWPAAFQTFFVMFSKKTSVSQRKQDHRLPHRTYIASLLLLGTTKGFFYPLVKLWPGSGQTLKTQKYGPPPMPTHETTSDPLYNLVQPISEGSDQRGPTFKSLTRPWSFAQKSCNGASKSCKWPSIRSMCVCPEPVRPS